MNKLISCTAAGVLLLAAGMEYSASAAPFGRASAPAAGGLRGGSASVFHGNAVIGGGSPVFRGNNFSFHRGDRDGDGFRHRRFLGGGVYAYDYPYDYFYDDGSAYADNCGYVWIRRKGVPQRVYTCE
jgi:hypothetical protein